MFAYCGNNPINACDPTGYLLEWVNDAWDWITEAASDVGEAIWDGLTAAGRGMCIASGWCADREADVFSFVGLNGLEWFERDVVAEFWWGLAGGQDDDCKQQTVIYRYHATKNDNLAPRKGRDENDGLSFSTKPPKSTQYPAVKTTIEAVKATGVLTATIKGNHVSIVPTNGTIEEWINQGQTSEWSQKLASIVIEIGD